jgi:lipid-binding SYLF domain-containing protein
VRSFVDSKNNGLDKVIPNNVLEKAAGFAIFTVVKAGFLVSARAGSGVVIARLPDGGESLLPMEMVLMGRLVSTKCYWPGRIWIWRSDGC